ncbi:MAG: M23/M56 family metallopeptidase [Bacteroidota bacterium]
MMSSELFPFLVKGSLIWVVFYGIYWALYRKNQFHTLNRFILLSILLGSLTLPFIQVEYTSVEPVVSSFAEPSMELMIPIQKGTASIKAVQKDKLLWQIGLGIYLTGLGIAIIRFIWRIGFLIAVTKGATSLLGGAQNVFETQHPAAPFSFMTHIYLPTGMEEEQLQLVLLHEKAHVRQCHSLDILLLEVYALIFWFNPFLASYRHSLRQLHEYLADEEVLSKGVSLQRYLFLLKINIRKRLSINLTQAFFQSTIKNRIHMMTANKQSGWWRVSYAFFLPVVAAFILAFTAPPELDQDVVPNMKPLLEEDITYISSGYGMRKNPWTKEMMLHTGVDLVAEPGTKVLATADGVVVEVSFKEKGKGHGRMVVVKHNDTYTTAYSQLSAFNVKEGDQVKQGEVVGFVGSSGLSTGPHLHYEVWKDGEKVNPENYF